MKISTSPTSEQTLRTEHSSRTGNFKSASFLPSNGTPEKSQLEPSISNNANFRVMNTEVNSAQSSQAKPTSLKIEDLKPGDILFMHDIYSKSTHAMIGAVQFISNPLHTKGFDMTHVNIYMGGDKVAEASGQGSIKLSDLKNDKNLTFEVFRMKNTDIAEHAVALANKSLERRSTDSNYGNYSMRGTGGILRSSKFGPKAQRDLGKLMNDSQFYKTHCSGFVGGLLQRAETEKNGEPSSMKIHTKHSSPKALYNHLSKSSQFDLAGSLKVE